MEHGSSADIDQHSGTVYKQQQKINNLHLFPTFDGMLTRLDVVRVTLF